MKKFLSRLFFFLITLLIIAYAADYSLSHLLRKTNKYPGEIEVWNDIYNENAGCDIAVYGSSRAWVHVDPRILSDSLEKSCYNFGIDGHNFPLQYLRHLELIKHNKKPSKIILSVDMFTLQKRKDLYEPDQFLPFMLWNNNIRNYTGSYISYKITDYYLPLVRFGGKYNAIKMCMGQLFHKDKIAEYRHKGFRAMDRAWNSDLEKAKSQNKSYVVKTDPESIELFEKFIRECKEEDIELIIVYSPEYLEGQQFVSNRKDIMNMFQSYATQNKLLFLDYSSDSICLNKNLFYNASHLNKQGAAVFSSKLAHDLKGNIRR